MRRFLKIAGLAVVVLVVGVGLLLAATFMGRRPIMDGQDVNGMRVVADGFATVAVIPINDRQVALIDAGHRRSGPVAIVLLTHGHPVPSHSGTADGLAPLTAFARGNE